MSTTEKARAPSELREYLSGTLDNLNDELEEILERLIDRETSQEELKALHDSITLIQGKKQILREVSQICYERGRY